MALLTPTTWLSIGCATVVRRALQPHAGGPQTRNLGGLAGEERADAPAVQALLATLPSDEMTCWPVSARVTQTIYFDKIMFWNADPAGHPDWTVRPPPG
jgi:hypothetical protein